MSNEEMERRLRRMEMVFKAAMPTGVSLEDFKEHSRFCEHFLVTNVPLLGGKVPVKAGSGYGVTYLKQRSTEYSGNLFEIHLAAKINEFKKDNKHKFIDNRNVTLYKGILIHEAAHILEGSFEPLNLEDIFKNLYDGTKPIIKPRDRTIGSSHIDSIVGTNSDLYEDEKVKRASALPKIITKRKISPEDVQRRRQEQERANQDKEKLDEMLSNSQENKDAPTNAALAADLFNIVEDYRIEVNLCDRVKSRTDFKVCLDFINLVLIGLKGEYLSPEDKANQETPGGTEPGSLENQMSEEEKEKQMIRYDFTNFKNALLRKIKCGQTYGGTLSEIIKGDGNESDMEIKLGFNQLGNKNKYESVAEIQEFEFEFFNKPTVPELQDIGIYNYRDLMDDMAERVYSLRGKGVVDSVELLPEIYRMLEMQFPENVDNYSSPQRNQNGSSCNNGEGGNNSKSNGNQSSNSDGNKEGDNGENADPSAGEPIDEGSNPTFGKTDDFTQGSIKPKNIDELKERKDEIQSRVDKIAENISDYYKKKKKGTIIKDGLNDDSSKDGILKEIIYEYDSKKQQVVPSEVYNKVLTGGDTNFERRIRSMYGSVIAGVYEQFEELKLNELQVLRMQSNPHSFNPVGVVFASVDPHFASQQRFYDASMINRRNYDIALLIDGSGSTSQPLENGTQSIVDPKRKTNVLDIEKIAASIIDISFRDLEMEDDFNIRKFIYQSSRNTDLYEFDHINALTTLSSGCANRDGAAIRSVTRKLLGGTAEDKILFLFADGMPADHNYEGGVYDTRMAIKEATDQDIKVFYILTKHKENVDSSEISAYKEIKEFATHSQLVIRPETLPYVVRDIVETYLV